MNTNPLASIAFLGLGLMGSRMTTRLLNQGFEVAVWNRTPNACQPLIEQGAKLLNLKDIAQQQVILLCLSDDAAVTQVYTQIEPYLVAGQIIVDFSSLSVKATQQLAKRAHSMGVHWVDSPVSGGIQGAEQGNLVIFAGGDAKIIAKLSQIYQVISMRVTRMGEHGSGQATKICNQLIVAANSVLIAEAVALANRAGVDSQLLAPALKDGFADSKPFAILAPRMAAQQFEPLQWKVQTLGKDLNNALSLASDMGLNLPVANQALQRILEHAKHYAEHDLSTLIRLLEPMP